jgi:hypothetical protein
VLNAVWKLAKKCLVCFARVLLVLGFYGGVVEGGIRLKAVIVSLCSRFVIHHHV